MPTKTYPSRRQHSYHRLPPPLTCYVTFALTFFLMSTLTLFPSFKRARWTPPPPIAWNSIPILQGDEPTPMRDAHPPTAPMTSEAVAALDRIARGAGGESVLNDPLHVCEGRIRDGMARMDLPPSCNYVKYDAFDDMGLPEGHNVPPTPIATAHLFVSERRPVA